MDEISNPFASTCQQNANKTFVLTIINHVVQETGEDG